MACSVASSSSTLSLEDCTCPICMYVLIQPVTMPCQHELCMPCFKQNVEEASLSCPMCRTRIATWARLSAKQNKLVNEKRWKEIRETFPDKVQRRLEGKEDEDDDEDMLETFTNPIINIAEPGEIRKEYEEQLKQLEKQREAERSKEEEESARLIRQLQLEEDERQRRLEEEAEELRRKDEELARQLSEDIAEKSISNDDADPTSPAMLRSTRTLSTTSNGHSTLETFVKHNTGQQDNSSGVQLCRQSLIQSKLQHRAEREGDVASTSRHNALESDRYRDFVQGQFSVMSQIADKTKRLPETITSAENVATAKSSNNVVRSQCDSTTDDDDDSLLSDPRQSPLIPLAPKMVSREDRSSIDSGNEEMAEVPKKVVGLFPQEGHTTKSTKSVKINHSILSSDDESEVLKEKGLDWNKNNNSVSTTKKTNKSSKEDSAILSPQRSIKDWFSPSAKPKKDNGVKTKRLTRLSPKKNVSDHERLSKSVQKVDKKGVLASVSQSARKSKPVKSLQKSSKRLQYSEEGKQSVPLKETSQNSDKTVHKTVTKTKVTGSSEVIVPSPPKRRRKQDFPCLEEEGCENSDVVIKDIKSGGTLSKSTHVTSGVNEDTVFAQNLESISGDSSHELNGTSLNSRKRLSTKHKPPTTKGKSNASKGEQARKSIATKRSSIKSVNPSSGSNLSQSDEELDEDLRLALQLQRQFDMEDKMARQVDRSKGSESEYLLRHSSHSSFS